MIEVKTPSNKDIDLIIFDDEIYDRISSDNCPPKQSFKMPYEKYERYGCYLEGQIIGLMLIEPNNRMHFQVLKSYRYAWAQECLSKCLDKVNKTIFCEIATLYMPVINFAKKNGFKEVCETDELIKNNKIYKRIKLIYEG